MITLFSPAKINLFLRILGKRRDGYHELASLFQAIDLGDTLTFHLSRQDTLTCNDPNLPCDGSNLIDKAVQLFRQKSQLHFHVAIHLEKKIPLQAGLGGGSSNAATTLWALNALHGFPHTEEELQYWSAEIGSDLPFFFSFGTAYCRGRGEKVRHLPTPLLPKLLLHKPPEGLSTPAIYHNLNLSECSNTDPLVLLQQFYSNNPLYINDLEHPAMRLCPSLLSLKKKLLSQGHQHVIMSGSGTSMIGIGGDKENIKPLKRTPRQWWNR